MKRKIKFRAKGTEEGCKGRWFYSDDENWPRGESSFWNALDDGGLDRDTLGEFIGLKDSEGIEIYEGDILSCSGLTTLETVTVKDIRKIPVQVSAWPTIYGKGNGSCVVIGNVYNAKEKQNENGNLISNS